MATVLMACVGNSDVQLNGERIKESYRAACETLLGMLEQATAEECGITLPLIWPALEFIENRIGRPLDKVVLFVTDQPPTADKRKAELREKDTCIAGQVIRKVLAPRVPVQLEVMHCNPSSPVETHEYFARRMPDLLHALGQEVGGVETIYTEITGGVQACIYNMQAALFNATEFDFTLHTVYVSEETQSVLPGDYALVMRNTQLLRTLEQMIKDEDYSAAQVLVKNATRSETELGQLLKALGARQLGDFSTALELFKKLNRPGAPDVYRALQTTTKMLMNGARDLMPGEHGPDLSLAAKTLVQELWHHIRRRYLREDYTDFLSRFWALRENLLRYVAEAHLGAPISKEPSHQQALRERINQDVTLRMRLRNSNCLRPDDGLRPELQTYMEICRYFAAASPLVVWMDKASDDLRSLRNSLATTHHWKEASRGMIDAAWNNNRGNIITDTEAILRSYFGVDTNSPYQAANTLVIRLASQCLGNGDAKGLGAAS